MLIFYKDLICNGNGIHGSSDDASGKFSRQATGNTRRLKKKSKELQQKLATGKHRSASHRSKAEKRYKSGLVENRKVAKEAANRGKITALLKTQASVVPFLFEDGCSFADFKEAIQNIKAKANSIQIMISSHCFMSSLDLM